MTRVPTLAEAKAEAKALRARLAAEGAPIPHAAALERVAKARGFRDWNALHAAAAVPPVDRLRAGDRVSGRYLGQPFEGVILRLERPGPGWARLELQLDEAVDVVTFESFSNFRSRVRGEIGPEGFSRERTSDGTPHLALDL